MKKQTVHLAIPTMGWLNVELAVWARNNKLNPMFASRISPVSRARNMLVEHFLTTDAKYLLMIDADTIPPANALPDLLAVIKNDPSIAIATGITHIVRANGKSVNVYQEHADVEKELTLNELPHVPFRVVGAGASCMLIKREAIEKLPKPYFKTIEFDNGAHCSEDLYFCEQIIKSGGNIVAHPGVICEHLKEVRI